MREKVWIFAAAGCERVSRDPRVRVSEVEPIREILVSNPEVFFFVLV